MVKLWQNPRINLSEHGIFPIQSKLVIVGNILLIFPNWSNGLWRESDGLDKFCKMFEM